MPGYDRSGPLGEGPMTGRGAGPCGGGGAFGRGWRRSGGRGFFGRPRFGLRNFFSMGAVPAEEAAPATEAALLKQQQADLQEQLQMLAQRIAALEGAERGDEAGRDG
jgi:hypothetical protein